MLFDGCAPSFCFNACRINRAISIGMVFVGISEEWSDEQTEESSGGLPKARYVPIVNSDADMDHGLIIALTMVVLCVILILLAAVSWFNSTLCQCLYESLQES